MGLYSVREQQARTRRNMDRSKLEDDTPNARKTSRSSAVGEGILYPRSIRYVVLVEYAFSEVGAAAGGGRVTFVDFRFLSG